MKSTIVSQLKRRYFYVLATRIYAQLFTLYFHLKIIRLENLFLHFPFLVDSAL